MSSGGGGASVGVGTGFTGGFGPGVNEGGVSVGVVAAVDCPPESERRPGSSRLGAHAPASIEINTSAAIRYLRMTMPPLKQMAYRFCGNGGWAPPRSKFPLKLQRRKPTVQ